MVRTGKTIEKWRRKAKGATLTSQYASQFPKTRQIFSCKDLHCLKITMINTRNDLNIKRKKRLKRTNGKVRGCPNWKVPATSYVDSVYKATLLFTVTLRGD